MHVTLAQCLVVKVQRTGQIHDDTAAVPFKTTDPYQVVVSDGEAGIQITLDRSKGVKGNLREAHTEAVTGGLGLIPIEQVDDKEIFRAAAFRVLHILGADPP